MKAVAEWALALGAAPHQARHGCVDVVNADHKHRSTTIHSEYKLNLWGRCQGARSTSTACTSSAGAGARPDARR